MLAVYTDALEPLEVLRRFGISAELVWAADSETPALVLVPADPETLIRLAAWLEPEPT